MRERRVLETDAFRDRLFRECQKPQDEEDEEGGYVKPQNIKLNFDYDKYANHLLAQKKE